MSHTSGDDEGFYSVALQVAAKAARQGHHRMAADLKKLVDEGRRRPSSGSSVTAIAQPRGELADLVEASFPDTRLGDLVVPAMIHQRLTQVIAEQRQRHALMDKGFNPVHRLLLEGPPGTGKTMTAAVLAHELSLPLLTVRLDSVLSKFLGESSSKLRILFEAIASQRGVYLFDEFDALGANRSGNDVGEARRILSSFLVFLDQANAESLVVATTNTRSALDKALFRRFDMVISYSHPGRDDAIEVIRSRLGPLGSEVDWTKIATRVEGLSHAELVQAGESAAKWALLADQDNVATDDLINALSERSDSGSAER